jgi:TatD DNase family protein
MTSLPYKLHDTHAHLELLLEKVGLLDEGDSSLDDKSLSFLETELENHSFVIQPTVSQDNYTRVTSLFDSVEDRLPTIYYLLGAHPEIVKKDFDVAKYMAKLATNHSSQPDCVGIGEVGLDYYYTQESEIVLKQKELFIAHIELALSWDLPIIIHCREAFEDLFEILDNYPVIHGKFLIHCFTGGENELKQVLDRGGLVAYGGVSTYPSAKDLRETLDTVPLESFVLETDLPYLSPQAFRGQTCLPKFIESTASNIAKIKDIEIAQILHQSEINSVSFFGLKVK